MFLTLVPLPACKGLLQEMRNSYYERFCHVTNYQSVALLLPPILLVVSLLYVEHCAAYREQMLHHHGTTEVRPSRRKLNFRSYMTDICNLRHAPDNHIKGEVVVYICICTNSDE